MQSPEGKAVTTRGFDKQQSLSKPARQLIAWINFTQRAGAPSEGLSLNGSHVILSGWRLLPVVLLRVLCHGFGDGSRLSFPPFLRRAPSWMTFFIARRLWVNTVLMLLPRCSW